MTQLEIGFLILALLFIFIGLPICCICCYKSNNDYDYECI